MSKVNYTAERTYLATPHPDTDYPGVTPLDPLAINVDGTGGTIKGKPVLTLDEVVGVLNRTSYPGTEIGGPGWDQGEFGAPTNSAKPGVIHFAFQTEETMFAPPYVYVDPATGELTGTVEYFGFQEFSAAQKTAARAAIGMWDEVVAYSFVETSVAKADITYGNYTNQPGTQAYAYLPYDYGGVSAGLQGDVWVNGDEPSNLELGFGDYGPITLIHETGHAIGLQHPGAYNAAPGLSITYAADAEYYQDSRQYSVMSYFNPENTGAAPVDWNTLSFVYAQTPLIHDIATVQAMYGADTKTRTGNTVYGFNSNAGRDVYDFKKNDMPMLAIWDAGGIDTLDLSGFDSNSSINLAPGAFSSGGGSGIVPLETLKARGLLPASYTEAQYTAFRARYNSPDGLLHDNISIAYGATIENAVGGGGNDTILGNAVANRLTGNAGDDTISGLGGADKLSGGLGDDTLSGDAGADYLYGGAGKDTLNGGADDDVLYGDGGNDVLNGGAGDDQLTGGQGADTMRGGTGNDTYYVDDAGDALIELANEGTDVVVSTLQNFRLAINFETLTLGGTGDINGSGNDAANTVKGNAGDNSLQGQGGNDTVSGYGGDDLISGGTGDDLLDGGDGIDMVTFKLAATSGVTVDLSRTVRQQTGQGNDLLRAFENLEGTAFGDRLSGDAGANQIRGLEGNDVIRGRGGADDLTGGAGADQFVFDSAATNGVDRIRDFASGIDKLVFYTGDGYAADAFVTFGSTAAGKGAQFVYDDAKDLLWYDADGAGGAHQILLANLATTNIAASDIVVRAGTLSML